MADPYPTITFQVNLALHTTEAIGPNTNVVNPEMLHPDRHQDDQDNALTDIANRPASLSTWLPGLLAGENANMKNGDQFTLHGQKATYMRDNYANGFAPADRAWLDVV